ncbi:A disintegrin and metalloproteinase with thrombospondin motifs 16-like [Physella acuta]|uniref:A disintegrin and metalloproteinase with thrombospondin motifs 16-like n=1 Tax=Physella acuta TaxID=109671 RepID=UPI0027DBE23A|nr:A disintegrin and metalloproteinase with thrombospondin motifs 16-like [Physella acuta]
MFKSLFESVVLFQLFCIQFSLSNTVVNDFKTSDANNQLLPDDVNFTVSLTHTTSVFLQLKRVHYIGVNTPVYTLRTNDKGTYAKSRLTLNSRKNMGFYQDISNLASFQIERINKPSNTNLKFVIVKGNFEHEGKSYSLSRNTQPTGTNAALVAPYKLEFINPQIDLQSDDGFRLPDIERIDSTPKDQSRRRRREASGDYYIDITAMVDYKRWNMFLSHVNGSRQDAINNVLEHYAYIFNRLDLCYQNIKSLPFKLNILLAQIIICETTRASDFTTKASTPGGDHVDQLTSFSLFTSFIKSNSWNLLAPFDHVMLFTGYYIKDSDDGGKLAGAALLGATCRNSIYSYSIITDVNEFTSETVAHEFAHSLGIEHDGDDNTCSPVDGYLVAPIGARTLRFSNCSINYLNTFINAILSTESGAKCLATKQSNERLPGLMYTPTEQCVLKYGDGSYDCRLNKVAHYCGKMFCYNITKNICNSVTAALEGTTCGNGKLCRDGKCVRHGAAPNVDDTCVYGLETVGDFESSTCAARIQAFPGLCYQKKYSNNCCTSCKNVFKNIKGCEYGDRYKKCVRALCRFPSENYLTICCKTCS